jgi:hypothetical protein
MAQKSARVVALEDSIAEATAILDEAPVSLIGLQEAIDEARDVMKTGYGTGFETAVGSFVDQDTDDEDGDGSPDDEDETDD